jgi:hypothetical protein
VLGYRWVRFVVVSGAMYGIDYTMNVLEDYIDRKILTIPYHCGKGRDMIFLVMDPDILTRLLHVQSVYLDMYSQWVDIYATTLIHPYLLS